MAANRKPTRPRRPGVLPTAGLIVEGDAEFAALMWNEQVIAWVEMSEKAKSLGFTAQAYSDSFSLCTTDRHREFLGRKYPSIYKFRTIDEANAWLDGWSRSPYGNTAILADHHRDVEPIEDHWELAAMEDRDGRRGIWFRVKRTDRTLTLEVCGGREGNDFFVRLVGGRPPTSEEVDELKNILDTSAWVLGERVPEAERLLQPTCGTKRHVLDKEE